jgi:hypothetical protein
MTMQAIPIEPDLIARHGLKADEYQVIAVATDLPEPGYLLALWNDLPASFTMTARKLVLAACAYSLDRKHHDQFHRRFHCRPRSLF